MPERQREPRSRALLRLVGIVLAIGLTIAAAWMIALGHSQREVSLGVIAGLWAALFGAMAFYSGRHSGAIAPAGGNGSPSSSDVELRQNFAVEMQREVSARRAYEQQLHEMVRREIETIQRVVGDQLGKLRDDVATLRSDLVDQVGGKIRLERIETTRVIGSDIEALQNEVRQLAGVRPAEPADRADRSRSLTDAPSRVFEAAPVHRSDEPAVAVARPGLVRSEPPAAANGAPPKQPAPSPAAAPMPPTPAAPAYQPYVAPTYAPAVTYAAGPSTDPNEVGRPVPMYSAPAAARTALSNEPVAASRPEPAAASVTAERQVPASQPLAAAMPQRPTPAAPPQQPQSPQSPQSPQGQSPQSQVRPPSPSPVTAAAPSVPTGPTFIPSTPLPSLQVPPLPPSERPINGGSINGGSVSGGSVSGGLVNGGSSYNGAGSNDDPFAALPRLTRFDDTDDNDNREVARPNGAAYVPSDSPWSQPPASPPLPVPTGRRHGAPEEAQSLAPASESGGGRRRRAEGDTNDVLARLLNNQ
jgi:hypothetical protein